MQRFLRLTRALLLPGLLLAGQCFAQPLIRIGSGSGLPGETVTVDVFFEGGDSGVTALDFDLRFDTTFLEVEGCLPVLADAVSSACSASQPGRVTFISFSLFLDPLADGQVGSVTFRISPNVPGPGTDLLFIGAENYSGQQAQNVDPSGDSTNGFIRSVSPGEPTAVDRFEDNDGPLGAKASDSSANRSDTHWFDSDSDEDWVLVNIGQGTFEFEVCNGMCGDGGEVTPNAQVYGPDRITDPGALPIAEFNRCDAPNSPAPGTEIVGAQPPALTDNQVYLIRIRDCYGLHGPEFPYDLFMNIVDSEQQTAKITGTVTAGGSGMPIGAYVFVSSDQVTASDPQDGSYLTVVDPGVELQLTVLSESAQTRTFTIPPLGSTEVRTVDLEVIGNLVFSDGFE